MTVMNKLTLILSILVVPIVYCQFCEPRWILFGKSCYKRVEETPGYFATVCKNFGSQVVGAVSGAEKVFIQNITVGPSMFKGRGDCVCKKPSLAKPFQINRKRPAPKNELNCAGMGKWYGLKATNKCYSKLMSNAPITWDEANNKCKQQFGGTLAMLKTPAEYEHVFNLAHEGTPAFFFEQAIVGLKREGSVWKWIDGTVEGGFKDFNQGEPNDGGPTSCAHLIADEAIRTNLQRVYNNKIGLLNDNPCTYKAQRYICSVNQPVFYKKFAPPGSVPAPVPTVKAVVAAKPVQCPVTSEKVGNGCRCRQGYTDILDTDMLDRDLYERGQHCIMSAPCASIKSPIDLLFVVDDSGSIVKSDWTSIVKFLRDALSVIPRTGHVGFVKFSSLAEGFWLSAGFSDKEYLERLPANQDGYKTNTPEALRLASDLLNEKSSNKQVVILITDGVPQISGYSDEQANQMTIKASKKLQSEGTRVLVVGIGQYLTGLRSQMLQWVATPSDYFNYAQQISKLSQQHMRNIMMRVCLDE